MPFVAPSRCYGLPLSPRCDLLFGRLRLLPASPPSPSSPPLCRSLDAPATPGRELDGNEGGSLGKTRSIIEIGGNKSRAPENHSIAADRNAEISYRAYGRYARAREYFFFVEYRVFVVELPYHGTVYLDLRC